MPESEARWLENVSAHVAVLFRVKLITAPFARLIALVVSLAATVIACRLFSYLSVSKSKPFRLVISIPFSVVSIPTTRARR